jgi:hypothetical protein
MKDLTNPVGIKLKGLLFLVIGIVAVALILLGDPRWQTGVLLFVAIWSFCRFYYFAFYVIEKHVDPNYKFSGLVSFAHHLFHRQEVSREGREEDKV